MIRLMLKEARMIYRMGVNDSTNTKVSANDLLNGQGSKMPFLQLGQNDLMKIIAPDILFDIKRTEFFCEGSDESNNMNLEFDISK